MTERTSDPRCKTSSLQPKALADGALDPGPLRTLRLLVVAVDACGLMALALVGLLPPLLAGAGLAAVAGAEALAYSWREDAGQTLRRIASFGVLTLVLLALVAGPAGNQDTSVVLAEALLGLCVAHALVHDRSRDLAVGLLVGCLMLVLAATTTPGVVVAVPVVVGLTAVLGGIVVMNSAQQASAAQVFAPPPRTTRAPHHAGALIRTVLTVGAVTVLVMLIVPVPDGSQLRDRLAGGSTATNTATGPGTGRSVSSYSSGALDLRVRGDLTTDPVAFVPDSSPSLWRGTVYDTYEGGTWWSTPGGGTGSYTEIAPQDLIVPPPPEGPVPPGPTTTYPVAATEAFTGVIVAPGRPVFVRARGPVLDTPGALQLQPSAAWNVDPYLVKNPQVTYLVDAMTIPSADQVSAASGDQPSDQVRPGQVWTQLPNTLPPRVRELGVSLVASTDGGLGAIRTVERYVRANARYTLDSPVTPPDEDVVDDFLFDSQLGFCEHFASAEAVLLRAAGIPARVVTGFSSEPEGSSTAWRTLRVNQAHAWVEAWIPGLGWVSSDPTAGATLATIDQNRLDRVAGSLRSWFADLSIQARVAAAVLVIVLTVGLTRTRGWPQRGLWGRGRRLRPRGAVDEATGDRPPAEPLAAFHRLERILVGAGVGREPAETPTELGRRLRGQPRPFETVSEAAYAPHPPDAAAAQQAAIELDTLAENLRDQLGDHD